MKIRTFGLVLTSIWILAGFFSADASGISAEVPQNQTGATFLLTGEVTDTNGEVLPGAALIVQGTNRSAITDIDGKYSLAVSAGEIIRVQYVGFKDAFYTVSKRSKYNFILEDEAMAIDDAVVVAYGSQRKATITGSVASVGTKDLLQSPQANISNALAGRMAGLLAVQRSGEPGYDESTLRIRGIGTFNGDADPLVMIDGVESSNYNNIDPNEIESITILKDASATAVYGVRGANGVLLINTKRGHFGKPKVSISVSGAVSTFPFLRENMNSYEWASGYNKALAYDSYISGSFVQDFTQEQIQRYKEGSSILYPSVDWYDYMLRKCGYQHQENVNISGGTKRVKYFFSLGYFDQRGNLNTKVVPQEYDYQISYHRYNFRSNFDIDITKNFVVSVDLSTQIDDKRGPLWNTDLLMEMLSSVAPNTSPGYVDGKIVSLDSITNTSWTPLIVFNKGWKTTNGNTLNGSVRATYKLDRLVEGLKLRAAFSYKSYSSEYKEYSVEDVTYEAREQQDGSILYIPNGEPKQARSSSSVGRNRRVYVEGGIEYAHNFNGHNVGALFLYTQSKYYSPDLQYLVPNGYQGVVGRATYDYKSRYMAEFNIGYNGTENFAEGKRFGWFPSASLGWSLSDEPFFPRNPYVTLLKFRASYGIVGNDKIGGDRFLYMPTSYSYYGGAYHFGVVGDSYNSYKGASEGKIGNPALTWETAGKLNVGLDMHLFSEKVNFSVDWFLENRNNILCNRGTIPDIVGANMPAYNLGRMRNSGVEAEMTFSDSVGASGFRYWIKGNITFARNIILEQDEVQWPYQYQYRTGNRFGQIFGYVAEGLFNTWEEVNDVNRPVYQWNSDKIQPGDIRYKDINGDGRIDDKDIVPIGYSTFPEMMYGLSFGFNWRGLDFSILLQGASLVSTVPSRRTMRGFYTKTGASKDLLQSWSQERYEAGATIKYPRYSVTNDEHNYAVSTFWVEDASYLRVKSMEIGYNFQAKAFSKLGISSMRVYVNGNNLLTFCNLYPGEDPEYPTVSANSEPYPLTRTFNFGLNVNF